MSALARSAWSLGDAADAAEALARAAGVPAERRSDGHGAGNPASNDDLEEWIESLGQWLGVELESVGALYGDVDEMVAGCGPALMEIDVGGQRRLIAVLRSSRRWTRVLAPDGAVRRVRSSEVARGLRAKVEAAETAEVDGFVKRLRLRGARAERATKALLTERLGGKGVGGVWLLRLPAEASFRRHLGQVGAPRRTVAFLLGYVLQYLMFVGAWWMIGYGAFRGDMDAAWLIGFVLLTLGRVPLQLLSNWALVELSIDVSTLLRRRLLVGATRLSPDQVRSSGAGQLLGRVIESDTFEEDLISGAPWMPVGLGELTVACLMLGYGAGGLLQALALVASSVALAALARRLFKDRRAWTRLRVAHTHDLVERMVGHPTRLAQERAEDWHRGEDGDLTRFVQTSERMERSHSFVAAVPRCWLLVAMTVLAPAVALGATGATELALAVAGTLLGYAALTKLATGSERLARVAVSWAEVRDLFAAGGKRERVGAPELVHGPATTTDDVGPVIVAQDLTYRYPGRVEPVLRDCALTVRPGDRLLLQGPSGGGKSTLGACLTGVREPDGGLLLAGGLDRHSLGQAGWRRRVAGAPQFHENHVFNAPLLFNLLVARRWPPTPQDCADAQDLCEELGLGPLLERMPGGLLQMVGETGWQLSHGERSRVFLARALLQGSEVIVLDESFGALDPATCDQVMQTVFRRAGTLIVIAHT